ncbi:hypothetical protein [Natrialba sp. INN-245]|uniref:hypothetical protein n=1 Tax=Natrialba sp. INN-245 TaxID=2690967 RepID=UPI00131052CA|nr:hypothetical protein [Natrialba sp. INN-245]MWV40122.1 hypothetical protein [Natrialba sp. INN-245]
MSENAGEWERIARQLIYDQLVHDCIDRLSEAFKEVGEDIANGNDVTVEHLNHLAHAFSEVLFFIRECIVPLVDEIDNDELKVFFELEDRPVQSDN